MSDLKLCPCCEGELIFRGSHYLHPIPSHCVLSNIRLHSKDDLDSWNSRPLEDAIWDRYAEIMSQAIQVYIDATYRKSKNAYQDVLTFLRKARGESND